MSTTGPFVWLHRPRVTRLGTSKPRHRGARTWTRISIGSARLIVKVVALGRASDGSAFPVLRKVKKVVADVPNQLVAVTLNQYRVLSEKLDAEKTRRGPLAGWRRYTSMRC